MSDIEFKDTTTKVATKKKVVVKKSAMNKKKEEVEAPEKRRAKRKETASANLDQFALELENMDPAELNEVNIKAQIRQRTAGADKVERENNKAMGLLVDRKESIDVMVGLCLGVVDVLNLIPDQLGPQLHKKTPKQIREKLVKAIDKAKQGVIQKLEDLDATK